MADVVKTRCAGVGVTGSVVDRNERIALLATVEEEQVAASICFRLFPTFWDTGQLRAGKPFRSETC